MGRPPIFIINTIPIMAKSKSFFGLRKGSTKTLTFSVLDGQQITKDRVTDVKNPRSKAQMEQRCILKTTALAYSTLKSIVDHSFEGTTYGAASQRKFMQLNTAIVRNNAHDGKSLIGFASYKDSTPNMGQFIISQGSLAPIPAGVISLSFAASSLAITYNGGVASTAALANALGVNLGDIVTLCALVQNSDKDAIFVWLRMILPSEDVVVNAENVKFESNKRFSVSFDSNAVGTILFDAVDKVTSDSAALYGVIRSQKSDAGYKRSNTTLNLSVGSVVYDAKWSPAVLTYPQGESYILNGGDQGSAPSAGGVTPTPDPVEPATKYAVSINNSTAAVVSGAGQYAAGDNVSIVATSVPEGKVAQFSGVPGNEGAVQGSSVAFVMPASAVTITVALVDASSVKYQVTSNIGAGITGLGEYAAGSSVSLTNTTGYPITSWTIDKASGGHVEANRNGNTITFTMPAENVQSNINLVYE